VHLFHKKFKQGTKGWQELFGVKQPHLCTRTQPFSARHNSYKQALVAWRSGHRICLRNRRPGFVSLKGISFFRKSYQCCCVCTIDFCNTNALFVYWKEKRNKKALSPKIKKTSQTEMVKSGRELWIAFQFQFIFCRHGHLNRPESTLRPRVTTL
jgi:hypothetical protein